MKLCTLHLEHSLSVHRHTLSSRFHSHRRHEIRKYRCSDAKQPPKDRWKKLGNADKDAIQETLHAWLSKTQTFWTEMASTPKNGNRRNLELEKVVHDFELEETSVVEQALDRNTPKGTLSVSAVISIERFSGLNGLSGRKMQKIFKALAPESISNGAQNLIEYCCFRYLSRDNSDFHPSLKEPAFQRLIFIAMLAWEHPYEKKNDKPYEKKNDNLSISSDSTLQGKLVGQEAFIRIAAAVPGVADRSTVHYLYRALATDKEGISLNIWKSYLSELLRVHEGRKSYQEKVGADFIHPGERILCIGSSKKKPVLKWGENIGFPGKLFLTDYALYFQEFSLVGRKEILRLDLASYDVKLQKTRVGPMGSAIFDSAISVSSGSNHETWVLEFVDLGGEMRRDVWHAFISEVVSVHKFIHEYAPTDDDPSLHQVFGSHRGKTKAVKSAANSIARLQCLQSLRRLSEDPGKLVQFSYLRNSLGGDIVLQTLAVNIWGGPCTTISEHQTKLGLKHYDDQGKSGLHVTDIDGSIYLRKWTKSPSWFSSTSINFWKNSSVRHGVILAKDLVVGDKSLLEKSASIFREKSQILEKTQETIDAAVLEGIPSNIDLLKEIVLPFSVIIQCFDKLRRWERPSFTISFLVFAYTLIFRNLLAYVLPSIVMFVAISMLVVKGLRKQGRLGRSFGKITIRDQPPSSTIEKFIAIKEALNDVEKYLQKLNVRLLKIRAIVLARQPQVTTEVAAVLLTFAILLYIVPFRYVVAFLLLDSFTRELEFRREMVKRFMNLLKERWDTIPVAPVIVIPYKDQSRNADVKSTDEIKRLSPSKDKDYA